MKYCYQCGREVSEVAVFCPHCGAPFENVVPPPTTGAYRCDPQMAMLARVFMIVGCVLTSVGFVLAACWCIPMTVSFCRKLRNNEPISLAFKICLLIFVSQLGGIFALLMDNNDF